MRVAIFQDTWHPKIDGVVVSTDLFAAELRRRGHDVKLVVPAHPALASRDAGDDVVLVDAVGFDFIYPGTSLGKLWDTGLPELFARWRPDVLHSMTEFTIGHWLASYWREKLRVPRVHTFHTLWNEYLFYAPLPEALTQRALRLVADAAVKKRFDAVIAPTDAMRRMLADDWGVTAPIDVLPTGIPQGHLDGGQAARFRARHSVKADERVLMYLGRMGVEKNVELVVDAVAAYRRGGGPKVRLVLAGDGPRSYMERLRRRAADRELIDVVWTGFVQGEDWLDCYAAADVVTFPSVTETQGLVVVEALAKGVPVVAVQAMGPACVLAGEQGGLFSKDDAAQFAAQIRRLLVDDVLYARKQREAREVAKAYLLPARAAELEAIYERVLCRPQAPRTLSGELRDVAARAVTAASGRARRAFAAR